MSLDSLWRRQICLYWVDLVYVGRYSSVAHMRQSLGVNCASSSRWTKSILDFPIFAKVVAFCETTLINSVLQKEHCERKSKLDFLFTCNFKILSSCTMTMTSCIYTAAAYLLWLMPHWKGKPYQCYVFPFPPRHISGPRCL